MKKCFLNLNLWRNSYNVFSKNFSTKNKIPTTNFQNNLEIPSTNFYYKIFDPEYLENFYLFMTKITKKYNNNSYNSGIKNTIPLEKEIFNFLYKDKNISSLIYDLANLPIDEMNKMTLTSSQKKSLVRKNFITHTSYFIEMCHDNKLYSPNFTEFNKVLFYYLIHHQNIANRKLYPTFNINLILYFIENPNYEVSFKRLVIMKLLENIDILKFTQFIELTDKLSEYIHRYSFSTELFHPFNPLKLDQFFISDLIDKQTEMTFNDILKTLSMSEFFPLKEKIFIVKKILPKLEVDNYIDKMYTNQILYFVKSYKIFKCEMKEKNMTLTLEGKNILDELYLKIINKLKFRFKKITVERFCELGLNKVYSLIDDFTQHAKYIDDQEILEDFLSIVLKSSEKYDRLKNDMNFILQKFLHVHPSFAIKSLVNYWVDLILGNLNLSYLDTLCIIKCIMFSHNNPHVSFDLEKLEDQFKLNLLTDYVRGLYKNEKITFLNNFEEMVELIFYMTFVSKFKIIKTEEENFQNFFNSNFEIIFSNILSYFELSEISDLDTLKNLNEGIKISEILNNNFIQNNYSQKTLDYIYLLCEFYENKFSTLSNTLSDVNLNQHIFIKTFKEKYLSTLSKDLKLSKLEKKLTKLFHKYNPDLFKEKNIQLRLNKIVKFSENIHNYYVSITLIDLYKKENEVLLILNSPMEARKEIPSDIIHSFYLDVTRPNITKIISVSYDELLDSLKDYYSNILK
jgi:hypothetical protein